MGNRCTENRDASSRASERIWIRVMREGISVAEAAHEFGLSTHRLERVLIAVGKRRVARTLGHDSAPGMIQHRQSPSW